MVIAQSNRKLMKDYFHLFIHFEYKNIISGSILYLNENSIYNNIYINFQINAKIIGFIKIFELELI